MLRRILFVIWLPILITHAAYTFVGCAGALREVESVSDPNDDAKLSNCRKLGRESKADGATPSDAYAKYVQCTTDAGLR